MTHKPTPKAVADASPRPFSLDPSADIRFAVAALDYFREASKPIVENRILLQDVLVNRFGFDMTKWQDLEEGIEHSFVSEQEDAFAHLELALESFIRTRACATVGDLVEKLKIDRKMLSRDVKEIEEDYTAYCAQILRSLLPWLRTMGTSEAT